MRTSESIRGLTLPAAKARWGTELLREPRPADQGRTVTNYSDSPRRLLATASERGAYRIALIPTMSALSCRLCWQVVAQPIQVHRPPPEPLLRRRAARKRRDIRRRDVALRLRFRVGFRRRQWVLF